MVAFICWGPFFCNLILCGGLLDEVTFDVVQVMQYGSNLAMLAFAALSPFLYVFRSSKVQKCLGPVLYDTFCQMFKSSDVRNRRRKIINQASVRNHSVTVDQKCQHNVGKSCLRFCIRFIFVEFATRANFETSLNFKLFTTQNMFYGSTILNNFSISTF